MKTWMRRRGDRVTITTGKYADRTGTIESNVYQGTVDYPDEWAIGYHVMLDTDERYGAVGPGGGKTHTVAPSNNQLLPR